MTRLDNLGRLDSAPRWILIITGSYLVFGLFALYIWHVLSEALSMRVSWGGTDGVSITGMAAVQVVLCVLVLRSFPAGAPLRPAWILILLSAACRTASSLFTQVAGAVGPAASAGSGLIGGPVQMALLAAGLIAALRVLRSFGLWEKPRAMDWALTGIVGLFAVSRMIEMAAGLLAGKPISPDDLIALAGYPVLCALFFQALLLRRSVARMGGGMIARCWGSLVVAILVTGIGEIGIWAMRHYSTSWPVAAIEWYVWFPATVAFALAPAYQVAAQCRATRPVTPRRPAIEDSPSVRRALRPSSL